MCFRTQWRIELKKDVPNGFKFGGCMDNFLSIEYFMFIYTTVVLSSEL